MRRVFSFPYTFVVMNWAAVMGFYYFMMRKKDLWSSGPCPCKQQRQP